MEHKCHKEEIINRIDHAVNGNGKPGLKEAVVELNVLLKALNERFDRMEKRTRFNVTTIVSIIAVIIALIAIISKQ